MSKYRDKRCEHEFYKGLCPCPHCPHFDGKKKPEEFSQGIVHDAWGRGRRKPKHHETGGNDA